jgi:hypothetical protein
VCLFIMGLFYNTDSIADCTWVASVLQEWLWNIWKLFEVAKLRNCPGICLRRLNKTTYRRLSLHLPNRCHNLRDQNMRWRIRLRHWKVAGSIPDSSIEIIHWH